MIAEPMTPDEREAWLERAAIMEIDGGLSKEEAERRAAEIILEKRAKGPETPAEPNNIETHGKAPDITPQAQEPPSGAKQNGLEGFERMAEYARSTA
jgi:hypothetical protein